MFVYRVYFPWQISDLWKDITDIFGYADRVLFILFYKIQFYLSHVFPLKAEGVMIEIG